MGGFYVETKHLELRRQTWFCVLDVPAPLRPIVGQRRLRRTLQTRDVTEALKRRELKLAELRAILAEAAAKAKANTPAAMMAPRLATWEAEQRATAEKLMAKANEALSYADWCRQQIALATGQPIAEPVPTFREAAEGLIAVKRVEWRKDEWTWALRRHVFPHIGKLAVNEITTEHVLKFLGPLWASQPETAKKARSRIENILDYAKTRGWREGENPARWHGHLQHALTNRRRTAPTKHHPALPWQQLPAFVAQLAKRDSPDAAAMRFTILTATRTSEALRATWAEIDLEARVWTVPAARMKGRKEHRVPLSDAVVALLQAIRGSRQPRPDDFIFNRNWRPLGRAAMFHELRAMNRAGLTMHGFRSSFRDWATDTGKDENLAEAALAHSKGDATVRAYARSDALERRRDLMAEWAEFVAED